MAQIVYAFPERFQTDLIPLYMYANELNRSLFFMKAVISIHENHPPMISLRAVLEDILKGNVFIFIFLCRGMHKICMLAVASN